jgi:hypothetical protein
VIIININKGSSNKNVQEVSICLEMSLKALRDISVDPNRIAETHREKPKSISENYWAMLRELLGNA